MSQWVGCLFMFGFVLSPVAWAGLAEVDMQDVRPTQSFIGYEWANRKYEKFLGFDRKQLRERVQDDPAPAVLGRDGDVYILDNHHEFYAFKRLGLKRVLVNIIADYSKMNITEFEQAMVAQNWLYLGDEDGLWTLRFADLPKALEDLRDDPYRTLASCLRRQGGFNKVKQPYIEFQWANALRPHIPLKVLNNDSDLALSMALKFAWSEEAGNLPGYLGPSCEATLQPDE